MSDISGFESRTGTVTASAKDVYAFVTDIRNFEQFIPAGTISNIQTTRESCTFSVSMIGTISIRLAGKVEYSMVEFEGDALNKEDFRLTLHIIENGQGPVTVRVNVKAQLNPVMKMMASGPITNFLELLVREMENFRGWKEVKA